MTNRTALTVDELGAAMAHVAHFKTEGRPRVLAQLGLSDAVWDDATSQWLRTMQEEFDADDGPATNGFARAFEAARDRLAKEAPRLEDVRPLARSGKSARELLGLTALGVDTAPEDALPFVKNGAAQPPPNITALDITSDDMGNTVAGVLGVSEALPFGPGGPRLSLMQYASLQAEMIHDPAKKTAILARYKIHDNDALRSVEAAWARRLVADDALREQFDSLVATYTEWLERGGRR